MPLDLTNAICPKTEDDLCEVIRAAKDPLSICGGGTREITSHGNLVSTSAQKGIILYEPGAMTLVAKAGTSVGDIEKSLKAEGQQLAFEPMDTRGLLGTKGAPTIGGAISSNSSGPRRIQVGAARDHLLGVSFVDGAGTLVKNGGRVMKNVTGYDLVKLMAGSRGTLGVFTDVSLKVLPLPESVLTVCIETPDAQQGVAALSSALGSPFDISGAAWLGGVAYARIEGFAQSVDYRTKQLAERLASFGDVTCSDKDIWSDIRDVAPFWDKEGDVWRISVKPTDGPKVLDRLEGSGFLDWGGGLVWALVSAGCDVRSALQGISGHATCVRGIGYGPARHPEIAAVANLSAGIKAKFDPRGILNPL